MDSEIRKGIMALALGIGEVPEATAKPISESTSSSIVKIAKGPFNSAKEQAISEAEVKPVGVDEKLFEFRKKLKEIKAFERKIKIDSEDWQEEHWEQFESSLTAPVLPSNSADLFEAVLKNKAKHVVDESTKASEIRAEIIGKIDFSLFEKLM